MFPNSQLTIQTPEQITMELSPAGIGSRFLALALDTLIQVVLYVVLILLAVWSAPALNISGLSPQWAGAIVIFLLFCIYWGYFAAFEIFWNGQTPGKRLTRIRVVKDTGRPMTAIEGVGRNLMRAVDSLCFYFVGALSIILSKENKRLGDYVAGTIVIHDGKGAEVKPDWTFVAPASDPVVTPELSKISERDLVVIETFLHRRFDLDRMVRFRTAMQLSEMIQQKAGIAKAADHSDEDFLESTARQVRDQARLRT